MSEGVGAGIIKACRIGRTADAETVDDKNNRTLQC